MAKTLSITVGKGYIPHTERKIITSNVNPNRTMNNVVFCSHKLREEYDKLFGEAVKEYNARQTRSDRKIASYYDKIRLGNQERLFYEFIAQVGNRDDTPSDSSEGEEAKEILTEYYQNFLERNPNMHIVAASIHMDESTPHLHVDFVPYISNSKRGLSTRVSLKGALEKEGFSGGSRSDTELNQWIEAEKKNLEIIMQKHNVKRLDKGEHRKHLSVENFKSEMRHAEVIALDQKIEDKKKEKAEADKELLEKEKKVKDLDEKFTELRIKDAEITADEYKYRNDDAYKIKEPSWTMSARSYYNNIVNPFVRMLIDIICALCRKIKELERSLIKALNDRNSAKRICKSETDRGDRLYTDAQKYAKIQNILGTKKVDALIDKYDKEQSFENNSNINCKSVYEYDITR